MILASLSKAALATAEVVLIVEWGSHLPYFNKTKYNKNKSQSGELLSSNVASKAAAVTAVIVIIIIVIVVIVIIEYGSALLLLIVK